MTPYYADDLVTIYHGEADDTDDLDWDVIVTDPPYPKPRERHVLADGLRSMVIVSDSVAVFGYAEDLIRLCIAAGEPPDEWVVWWPTNAELKGRFAAVPVARETEHIALFGDLREARGAPVRNTHEYEGKGNNRAAHHISPLGKRWGDVWRDPSPGLGFGGLRRHPNEKPVSLMVRLLSLVADGIVLDPFAGSGSTLVAAKSLNRRAIGIEIEERYCEIAANRCRQEVLGLLA